MKPKKGQWSRGRLIRVFKARGLSNSPSNIHAATIGCGITLKILAERGQERYDGYYVFIKKGWIPKGKEFDV